ncbi:MscL family protein [Candidatus Saccharibacteria bacterium]|nr:MscL family protein [Candidatus Saccharibacteria bacterium]
MLKMTDAKKTEDNEEVETSKATGPQVKAALAGKAIAGATTNQLAGFVQFVREKGVVGLAIGLAIGTAATGLVNQIVSSVITPTVVLILGADGLKDLVIPVAFWGRSAEYDLGALIDALIKFIALSAVIYFIVLGLKLDKLDKKKEE